MSEYELSKNLLLWFSPENTLIFLPQQLELFLSKSFFSEHPKFYTYIFFLPSTLWKFFFGHLDFFSHKTLRLSLRHYTDTWHFFYFKKNLANVHPWTIDKFLSNIECNWHRNSFIIEITQSNIIEFIVTRHTHTCTFFLVKRNMSCELWIQ